MVSQARFYINSTCCFLMVLCTIFHLVIDSYAWALYCAIVATFTGFNAYLDWVRGS